MVTPELTQELQIILKDDYNLDLKINEVKTIGDDLVALFELLTQLEKQ